MTSPFIHSAHSKIWFAAGLFIWAIVCYLLLWVWPHTRNETVSPITVILLVVFIAGSLLSFKKFKEFHLNHLGLILMASSVVGLGFSQGEYSYLMLMIIFAGNLPYFFSHFHSALILLLLYAIALFSAVCYWQSMNALVVPSLYLCYCLAIYFLTHTRLSDQHTQQELKITNHALRATQQLLTDSAIEDERIRISRDLHDSLGHHLTALSLQLEIMRQLAEGKLLQHAEQSQAITRLLLGEVREVVADLRVAPELDLEKSLRQLAEASKIPIMLTMGEGMKNVSTKIAETFFRVVQEIITNSNRHSRSAELRITLAASADAWTLESEDGGHAKLAVVPGNGITGMLERVERCGGHLDINSDQGLKISVSIPRHD